MSIDDLSAHLEPGENVLVAIEVKKVINPGILGLTSAQRVVWVDQWGSSGPTARRWPLSMLERCEVAETALGSRLILDVQGEDALELDGDVGELKQFVERVIAASAAPAPSPVLAPEPAPVSAPVRLPAPVPAPVTVAGATPPANVLVDDAKRRTMVLAVVGVSVLAGAGFYFFVNSRGPRGNRSVQNESATAMTAPATMARKRAPAMRAPAKVRKPTDNLRCTKGRTLTLKNVGVAPSTMRTLSLEGDCRYVLVSPNLTARRGRDALRASEGVKIVVRGGRLSGGIRADKGSEIRLENVNLTGRLRADDTGVVIVSGGTIIPKGGGSGLGLPQLARVDPKAVVVLHGVKITGKYDVNNRGVLLKLEAGEPLTKERVTEARQARARVTMLDARFGPVACHGVLACYQARKAWGRINVQVQVSVGPTGAVTRSKVKARNAPFAVKKCLRKIARGKKLDGYKGRSGLLECSIIGTIAKGSQMMSYGSSFTESPAPQSKTGKK